MAKSFRWLLIGLLTLLVLLAALAFGLQRWVSTGDFRQRMELRASTALGVPVVVGNIAVDVWPFPAVALGDLTIQSQPPVTLERLELRPRVKALLHGELSIATLILRKVVLPQKGVDAILLAMQKNKQLASRVQVVKVTQTSVPASSSPVAPTAIDPMQWLPRRTVFDDVTWVSNAGTRTALEGEARLGADALPDTASLHVLRGNLQGLQATLDREPQAAPAAGQVGSDQWALNVDVGGGKIEGKLGLQRVSAGGVDKAAQELVVTGKLETRDVELTALTAPGKPVSGLLEASTTLNARAATTAGLVDALQTQTSFTVRNAVLNGIDLEKAVKSVGMSRGGQTQLQTLAGRVATQGKAAQLSNLVASSGYLSASGDIAVSPARALSGHVAVKLSGDSKLGSLIGATAVPLVVGGTLDAPEVTLSRSALVGAAIGTALMPGVGTGAGAKLGEKLSEGLRGLFGNR
jgi:hypothetical protein